MDRSLYFSEDPDYFLTEGYTGQIRPGDELPTVEDWLIHHKAMTDPTPRQDLVHPFED